MALEWHAELEPPLGTVLACYGSGWVARGIQIATCGPSHVAIVVPNLSPGQHGDALSWVMESTSLSTLPCRYRGRRVIGVQVHEWSDWLVGQERVEVAMLNKIAALDEFDAAKLTRVAKAILLDECNYDIEQAILSGTNFLRYLTRADASRLFCSELVMTILGRLSLASIKSPQRYTPAGVLRELRTLAWFDRPVRVIRA